MNCAEHKIEMELRPIQRQTKEQKFCGIWYDCLETGCSSSILVYSKELIEFLKLQKVRLEKQKQEKTL